MSVGVVNKQTGDRIPTAGMPAIDNALSLSSTNPVQNAIITSALANKQDKTDNSLQTTDKTVVGGINELKSGLTNYEATTNAALAVPENTGKNVLPYPFSETTKTVNGVTFTDNGDGTISTSGQATERTIFYIKNANANLHIPAGTYTVSKSYQNAYTVLNVDGYNGNTWVKSLAKSSSTDDVTITVDYDGYDRITMYLEIGANINTDNLIFKPMIRPATITDSTYAPYIPSVESRIEAVESGLTSIFLPTSRLTAVNDLDGVIKPGAYYFRDADNPANAPASNCYIAVIRQYDNSPRIAQIAYSFSVNTIYVRKTLDWGSTWGDWYSLDNTQVTQ